MVFMIISCRFQCHDILRICQFKMSQALWRSGPRRHSAGSRAESRLGRRCSSRSCRNCSTAWDSAWKKIDRKSNGSKTSHFAKKNVCFWGFEPLPRLHQCSSKPERSDRKGGKRWEKVIWCHLNHAKHPIESRPWVVPFLGRHQQASPGPNHGNQWKSKVHMLLTSDFTILHL